MSTIIHPLAIVSHSAHIGHGVVIGPYVFIGDRAFIGDYSVIGGRPEHRDVPVEKWAEHVDGVYVGDEAIISEFVTVHSGIDGRTHIGNGACIHNHSHIAHNVGIGNGSTIGGHTTIAGHVQIMNNAWISGQNSMHQWCVVGAYGFLGAGSFLKGHLPPGEKWMANPARPAGENSVGLLRAEMTFNDCRDKYDEEFKRLVSLSRLP